MKDYLTAKEFAAAAHVSPQTIYKQMGGRLAPYVKTVKGQKRIAADALKDFYEVVEEEGLGTTNIQPETTANQPDPTINQSETTTNQPDPTAENQPKTTESNPPASQDQQIEALNKLIEIVQKELEEKDRQLAVKDKQIQDLSDRLAEALQLTKGQQYIAAADKTKELIAARGQQDQEEGAAAADQEETTAAAAEDQADQEEPQPREKGFLAFLARLFKS